jgi:hypothetical protein
MQPDLFSYVPPVILGDRMGETYEPKRDRARLNSQAQEVFRFMSDNCWHSLREISEATKWPEASISARLRDFRSPKFGSFTVERRHLSKGLHQYRVLNQAT